MKNQNSVSKHKTTKKEKLFFVILSSVFVTLVIYTIIYCPIGS